jgi:DUF1365 family protein
MTFQSAVYEGWVRHRRFAPTPHVFRYALFMMYLDLDEIPEMFRGHLIWGHERPGVGSFRRADYLGDPRQPLRDAVGDVVEERLGRRPIGPIRLLTHLRYFGYSFNPVSIYYCFAGAKLDAIVLEVRNTPWGQRHCYVLDAAARESNRTLRYVEPKAFHVSPFLTMDLSYRFAITPPAERLAVHMDCVAPAGKTLDATLWLERRPWNRSTLTRILFRFPWMTGTVIGAIYWQALRLWWKRVPYVPHPHEISSDEYPPTRRPSPKIVAAAPVDLERRMGTPVGAAATRRAP